MIKRTRDKKKWESGFRALVNQTYFLEIP